MQYLATVLSDYYKESNLVKSIEVFLLDVSHHARNNYQISIYKLLKTIGVKLLNEKSLGIGIIPPYFTFEEFNNVRIKNKTYNKGNNSTYILDMGRHYEIYGKTYGANGKEATMLANVLANLAKKENKKILFYPVKDNDSVNVSQNDIDILQKLDISIQEPVYTMVKKVVKSIKNKSSRNQPQFKYNLSKKFGPMKCLLCDCASSGNMVASHIHRVADIDKSQLTEDEKFEQATSADNGFWLCSSHDKFFEHGNISFDFDGKLIFRKELPVNDKLHILEITKFYHIDSQYINNDFKFFLNKHHERNKLINNYEVHSK